MTTTDLPAGGLVEPKKDGASGSAGGTMGGCVGGRGMSVAMVVSCSVVVGAGGLACDQTPADQHMTQGGCLSTCCGEDAFTYM